MQFTTFNNSVYIDPEEEKMEIERKEDKELDGFFDVNEENNAELD